MSQTLAWAGSSPLVWAAVALVALLLATRLRAVADLVVGIATTVVAMKLTMVVKLVVQRPRPPIAAALVDAGGWAMPSTAAALAAAPSAALVVSLFDRFGTRLRAGAIAIVVLTNVLLGTALVYLGAHWLTDVLAGWLVGAAIGGSAGGLLRLGRRRRAGIGS